DGIRDRNVTGVQTCALPIYICHQGGTRRQHQPTDNSKYPATKNVRSFSHTASLKHLADSPCHCSPVAGRNTDASSLQRAPNVTPWPRDTMVACDKGPFGAE